MAQKALKKKPANAKKTVAKKAVAAKAAPKAARKAAPKVVAKKAVKKPVAKKPVVKATVKKAALKKPVAKPAAKAVKAPAAQTKTKANVVKQVAQKASRPVAVKATVKAEVKKQVVAATPVKTVQAPKAAAPAAAGKALYKVGNHVVYPTHGVGRIMAEETQMIGDVELRMLVIAFEKDKMTLRVPVHRATAAGLRPVSTGDQMKKVFLTLKGRARTSRGMWSRRAQEYEAKINSGNILSIAEVVRDLHQNVDQSERSYSERMIYESALSRLVGELAAAESTDHKAATDKLMKLLRAKTAATPAVTKEAA